MRCGDPPSGRDPRPQELLALLLDPTSVMLTQRFAERHAIELDTPVQLMIGDRVRDAHSAEYAPRLCSLGALRSGVRA